MAPRLPRAGGSLHEPVRHGSPRAQTPLGAPLRACGVDGPAVRGVDGPAICGQAVSRGLLLGLLLRHFVLSPQASSALGCSVLARGRPPPPRPCTAAKPPHGLTQSATRRHDARRLTDLRDFRGSIGGPTSSGGGAGAFAPPPPPPRRHGTGPRRRVRPAPAHRPTLRSQDQNPLASVAAAECLGEKPGPGVLVHCRGRQRVLR